MPTNENENKIICYTAKIYDVMHHGTCDKNPWLLHKNIKINAVPSDFLWHFIFTRIKYWVFKSLIVMENQTGIKVGWSRNFKCKPTEKAQRNKVLTCSCKNVEIVVPWCTCGKFLIGFPYLLQSIKMSLHCSENINISNATACLEINK